ncbi:hypothetical protein PR048_005054 [Dryococelus australis]|uniref:Uncharacterized protein n=1 Tax=Dryococelus australis TaxID=614101 RepID=A0ABQ9I751_9NEOP|nr:hypothetical protein PR048_005054 [Dryococelus australis]
MEEQIWSSPVNHFKSAFKRREKSSSNRLQYEDEKLAMLTLIQSMIKVQQRKTCPEDLDKKLFLEELNSDTVTPPNIRELE